MLGCLGKPERREANPLFGSTLSSFGKSKQSEINPDGTDARGVSLPDTTTESALFIIRRSAAGESTP